MSLPMTFVILTGGIDLSVGFLMTASAMVFSKTFMMFDNLFLGIAAALAAGLLFGGLNGIIVAKTKIHSWLVDLGTGKIAGIIPYQLILLIIAFVIFWALDVKSTLGRYLHAIGFNENAVQFSGVDTKRIQCLIFVLSGLMAAIAGLMFLGRSWEVNQTTAVNLNIEVITLVVLGGTSTAGGVGSVKGTFIAALII